MASSAESNHGVRAKFWRLARFQSPEEAMNGEHGEEHLVDQRVTYTLFKDGQLYVVENVPARVNRETGEQFFSSQTVEHLQEIVFGHQQPNRVIEAPVFEFA
jgi:hypothetical protein